MSLIYNSQSNVFTDEAGEQTLEMITFTQQKGIKDRVRIEVGTKLTDIAHSQYGDSSYWSYIAQYNGIANPFDLEIGKLIIIPEL